MVWPFNRNSESDAQQKERHISIPLSVAKEILSILRDRVVYLHGLLLHHAGNVVSEYAKMFRDKIRNSNRNSDTDTKKD